MKDDLFESARKILVERSLKKSLRMPVDSTARLPRHLPDAPSPVRLVEDLADAEAMLSNLLALPVTAIGVHIDALATAKVSAGDTSLVSDGAPDDMLSLEPSCLGLCAMAGTWLVPYVVLSHAPEVQQVLQRIFGMGCRFVFHDMKRASLALEYAGLKAPARNVFDLHIAATAVNLGRYHANYVNEAPVGSFEADEARRQAKNMRNHEASQEALSKKYDVKDPSLTLREEDIALASQRGLKLSRSGLLRTAKRAVVNSLLYRPMVDEVVDKDLVHHLETIEFPYILPNARVQKNGVLICPKTSKRVIGALQHGTQAIEEVLFHKYDVRNPRSPQELKDLLERLNVLDRFRAGQSYDLSPLNLRKKAYVHEAIPVVLAHWRWSSLLDNKVLWGAYVSRVDGRVHPDWRQNGSDTGRTFASTPAIGLIGRAFRPIVIAPPGFNVGGADLSQAEPMIAGWLSGDQNLIDDYNNGDVYIKIALRLFLSRLSPAQRNYSIGDFKSDPVTYEMREKAKMIFVGIIYGLSHQSIAGFLGIPDRDAERFIAEVYGHYPKLKRFLDEQVVAGQARGYGMSMTGLKRFRGKAGRLTRWERNWLRNMSIQSSAADLFKMIVIDLTPLYERLGVQLIIQLHDEVAFEVPFQLFHEVAALTKALMEQTVERLLPGMVGKVDLNIKQPHCWNKDGDVSSIERFMQDPWSSVGAELGDLRAQLKGGV